MLRVIKKTHECLSISADLKQMVKQTLIHWLYFCEVIWWSISGIEMATTLNWPPCLLPSPNWKINMTSSQCTADKVGGGFSLTSCQSVQKRTMRCFWQKTKIRRKKRTSQRKVSTVYERATWSILLAKSKSLWSWLAHTQNRRRRRYNMHTEMWEPTTCITRTAHNAILYT